VILVRSIAKAACGVLVMVNAAGLWSPAARADTIVLNDGYKFTCEIHDATKTFPENDPEQYVEFEIGTTTISILRSMTKSIKQDNLYQPPKTAEEQRERQQEFWAHYNQTRDTGETPAPVEEERSATLSADVTYLVNFAEATLSGGEALPVKEGDELPEGTELGVMENSRAEAGIGERVRVGIGAGGKIRFTEMQVERGAETVVWKLTLDVPMGEVWVEVSGLEAGEKVPLRLIGCFFTVSGDSLFSVKSALGLEYAFSYWKGPAELTVKAPDLRSGGFNLRPGYMVTFSPTGAAEMKEERLDASGMDAWKAWREFEPVEVKLEPQVIPPPLDLRPSEGVQYSLREASGGQSLDVEPEIKTNVLQDLQAYNAALVEFRKDVGRYPTAEEGLDALRENPGLPEWDGPYVDENVQRIDPWDQDYRYRLLGGGETAKPMVYSSGQNQIDEFGLGSDILGSFPTQ